MTTKNNFENLLQEIRDLDPTSPGAREKLQGYRIKILSAYKEIETFLKNEDLEDAARATIESRLQALANIYQSVRQLEDLLSKTDDAVVKSKEEEERTTMTLVTPSNHFNGISSSSTRKFKNVSIPVKKIHRKYVV